MTLGVVAYLIYHWTPALYPIGPAVHDALTTIQPCLVFFMLFLQFNRISPHDLGLRGWHIKLLIFQALAFIGFAFLAWCLPEGMPRLLAECAMLCFITPTATAGGVITSKLGGSLSGLMTYLTLINALVAILFPAVIPIIHPSADRTFIQSFFLILSKLFPMLIFPCIAAWTIRYTMRKVQLFFMRFTDLAFWIWCVSLAICLTMATRSLILSHMSIWNALLVGMVSLICCLLQFAIGRRTARSKGKSESITAGQALGQKNTVFAIWLGYSFLTPTTSITAGFYCIWHNIVNSYELYKMQQKS